MTFQQLWSHYAPILVGFATGTTLVIFWLHRIAQAGEPLRKRNAVILRALGFFYPGCLSATFLFPLQLTLILLPLYLVIGVKLYQTLAAHKAWLFFTAPRPTLLRLVSAVSLGSDSNSIDKGAPLSHLFDASFPVASVPGNSFNEPDFGAGDLRGDPSSICIPPFSPFDD